TSHSPPSMHISRSGVERKVAPRRPVGIASLGSGDALKWHNDCRRNHFEFRRAALRADEPLHHPQVAIGQTKRSIGPDADDAHQLLVRYGLYLAADHLDRAPTVGAPCMLFHETVGCGLPAPVGR